MSKALAESIEKALKELLSTKHLYQKVEVDLKPVLDTSKAIQDQIARASGPLGGPRQSFPQTIVQIQQSDKIGVNWRWTPNTQQILTMRVVGPARDWLDFELPSINTYCDRCKYRPPFNPIPDLSTSTTSPSSNTLQWYSLAYQCQQCQTEIVQFLVRRQGLKLKLTGRDPIEAVPPPKVLPKDQAKYFSNAVIAHQSGQTLAGIFLLRVFIEQFWRSAPAVQRIVEEQPRATGDEQGEAYQRDLPSEFKDRFPSLKEVYGDLSEAMHSADSDATLFDEACKKIEKHFDARRVFEL